MTGRRALGRPAVLVVLLLAGLAALLSTLASAASRPALRGVGGAVVSDARLATEVGLETLRAGGNAVDAAVATALALAVVAPEAGNLGGGGFAIVRLDASSGDGADDVPAFLDFREVAPAAATRDMYLDEEGVPVPEASLIGPLAAGVPGSPAGLHALHARYGRLPWPRVVEPARRLAADGFPVSRRLAASVQGARELLARFPASAALWLPGGEPIEAGVVVRQPELAATLALYARLGPRAISEGAVARAIEERSAEHGGILTAADLAAYRPEWREPLVWRIGDWTAATADLPSSGGVLLAASQGILERLGGESTGPLSTGPGAWSAAAAHRHAEAWRRAFADRFLLGDPATTEADPARLVAPAWLDRRAASIDPERATPSSAVEPWSGAAAASAAPESPDTTHLSVIDAAGGAVALTTTLNGSFGSGFLVPGAGFFLNNEMDDFAAAPGVPNLYGLVQGEANAVRPGRRMLSSMSPTIAWRGGGDVAGEVVALGGRGGSRIPTAVLQVLRGVVVDGVGLQRAVDRPRVHHQWLPDVLRHEPDALSHETLAALRALGHDTAVVRSIAQVHAARSFLDGTVRWHETAPDPRGGGGTGGVVEPLY